MDLPCDPGSVNGAQRVNAGFLLTTDSELKKQLDESPQSCPTLYKLLLYQQPKRVYSLVVLNITVKCVIVLCVEVLGGGVLVGVGLE